MGLVIGREVTKETAHQFTVFFDPGTGRPLLSEDGANPVCPDGQPAEAIRWYLRPLLGKDTLSISNAMMALRGGKGQGRTTAKLMSGTVTRLRVVRATVAVEGLQHPDGRPIERISDEIFDRLPEWLVETVHAEIMAMNGLTPDGMEAEDEGE